VCSICFNAALSSALVSAMAASSGIRDNNGEPMASPGDPFLPRKLRGVDPFTYLDDKVVTQQLPFTSFLNHELEADVDNETKLAEGKQQGEESEAGNPHGK